MLRNKWRRFAQASTSEMEPLVSEPYASMLGLIEAPPEVGDFDEGWRAINDEDFPMGDDPRTGD